MCERELENVVVVGEKKHDAKERPQVYYLQPSIKLRLTPPVLWPTLSARVVTSLFQ